MTMTFRRLSRHLRAKGRTPLLAVLGLGAAALAGCSVPPMPDTPAARSSDWPELLPLEPVLSNAATLDHGTDPSGDEAARAAALRARAAALRAAGG